MPASVHRVGVLLAECADSRFSLKFIGNGIEIPDRHVIEEPAEIAVQSDDPVGPQVVHNCIIISTQRVFQMLLERSPVRTVDILEICLHTVPEQVLLHSEIDCGVFLDRVGRSVVLHP